MAKTKTQVARDIMHANGKHSIYTNKYKKCRTVKCYASYRGEPGDDKLMTELKEAGFTVKKIMGNSWRSYGSIIARVDGLENVF